MFGERRVDKLPAFGSEATDVHTQFLIVQLSTRTAFGQSVSDCVITLIMQPAAAVAAATINRTGMDVVLAILSVRLPITLWYSI